MVDEKLYVFINLTVAKACQAMQLILSQCVCVSVP